MHKAHAAPRCGACTRGNTACLAPAMANGRCRMHGGTSTGPRTTEGLASIRAARTVHGGRSAEMRSLRRHMRALLASTAELKGTT
ncbi:HGGxSTG domain-containing protein [Roseomonas gilardii]|uniref:HGGxSTG domain-containing protein n=1 Tax=Roseomonas gilardii TaxID=257708 RepID=UPI0028D03F4E|nr:HGGxSTG domain-containing protein [Roseomonas gilardii]